MHQNQTKSPKVYQLAIQFSQYSGQENLPQKKITISNTYQLPKIIDVDEEDRTARKNSPFKNIFNVEDPDHMKSQQLTNEKSFNIVGRKEVKAYIHKLVKKKNILQRRNNESALSLSRYSSSVKSQNQTGLYLNKQDVLSFLSPSANQTQNESKLARDQQMLTMGSCKTKLSQQFEMPSLRKSKDAFENYTRTWDQGKMKKIKFPSILDHIASYRKKVEEMQGNALNEKKLHVKDSVWMDTLRTPKNVENFYSDKFVQKIVKDSDNFVLRGRDKLQREMQWIDQKDRAGYLFGFLDDLAIKPGKLNRQEKVISKQEKLGQSFVNRGILRDSSVLDRSKESGSTSAKVGVINVSSGNMKGLMRVSCQQKKLSKPPVLSQFSSTGRGLFSPLKKRPTTIGVSQAKQEQNTINDRRGLRI